MRTKQDASIGLEEAREGVEARKYGAKKEVVDLSIALTILAGTSLPATIIGNFFIKFNRPSIPTKMFKKEENALKWLNSFRELELS